MDYTRKSDGAIVVAEYQVSSSDPNVADSRETAILTIPHPNAEHNGGMLAFGPDGFLYISTGDGGLGNDAPNNAQNLNSLLGKILRIDIDHPASANARYSSPPSNPFFGSEPGLDEIYALGLRNPFRFSFDPVTGEIYAGDVGQDAFEEIDVIEAGKNYGWRVFEGTLCTGLGPAPCDPDKYAAPILDYGHTGRNGRCAITGGYVYRGTKQTFPFGAYIYGDYCTGEIFMLYHGQQQLVLDTTKRITSFGEDEDGELLVVGGTVDRIVNAASSLTPITAFSLADGGSVSYATSGEGDEISVNHAQIQPSDEESKPAGLAFIGFRKNGVLLSEAAIPATALIEHGRLYAEIDNGVDTGVAIANPDMARAASVTFNFTDPDGNDFGDGIVRIPPGGQISAFLDEPPFDGPALFKGSVTFTSSIPLSVIALRGITNERSELLTTTLPVLDLGLARTDSAFVPQFAAGGGWTTDVILVNPTNDPISGTVQFFSPAGQTEQVTLDGSETSGAAYTVSPRSSRKLQAAGGAEVRTGSFVVTPDRDNVTPSVAAIYNYAVQGSIVSATGADAVPAAMELQIYSEVSGLSGAAGSIESGLAIVNTSTEIADINFELITLHGESVAAGALQLQPNGQSHSFVAELPGVENLPNPFQGTLRLWSSTPVAVIGIRGRYNERGDFLLATTPPVEESADEVFIPQMVNGAGYSTQIVVYDGSEGEPTSGNIYFFDQNGDPIDPRFPVTACCLKVCGFCGKPFEPVMVSTVHTVRQYACL